MGSHGGGSLWKVMCCYWSVLLFMLLAADANSTDDKLVVNNCVASTEFKSKRWFENESHKKDILYLGVPLSIDFCNKNPKQFILSGRGG